MNRKITFEMNGHDEDLFFLSNGHISPVFYSVLARVGYFDVEELNTFRLLNSRLQGHPTTHEGLPGVRIASVHLVKVYLLPLELQKQKNSIMIII
jgi:transketolase